MTLHAMQHNIYGFSLDYILRSQLLQKLVDVGGGHIRIKILAQLIYQVRGCYR